MQKECKESGMRSDLRVITGDCKSISKRMSSSKLVQDTINRSLNCVISLMIFLLGSR